MLMTIALFALLTLSACNSQSDINPNQGVVDIARGTTPVSTPVVAGEEYVNLDGTPVEAGQVLEKSGPVTRNGKHVFATTPDILALAATVPQDTVEYQNDLEEMRRVVQTHEPGRLIGSPVGFTETGYPLYPVTCVFKEDHAECVTDWGQKIDEDDLERKLTLMRNLDVAFLANMSCGLVCVDEMGRVLGRVSVQMQAWRGEHCTFSGYGSAKCTEEVKS
jgi:hypothetical protein